MTQTQTPATGDLAARTLRIIAGALIAGPTIFLAIALVVGRDKIGGPDLLKLSDFMVLTGVVFTAGCLAASVLLSRSSLAGQLRALDRARLSASPSPGWGEWPRYAETTYPAVQTSEIIRMALIEGPTFFNVIIVLLTGSLLSLGLTLGLIALQAAQFPTTGRIRGLFERARQMIDASRRT